MQNPCQERCRSSAMIRAPSSQAAGREKPVREFIVGRVLRVTERIYLER